MGCALDQLASPKWDENWSNCKMLKYKGLRIKKKRISKKNQYARSVSLGNDF
jgi:hypothetical protein